MSTPISGITGRVHEDGGLPPAPHNSSLGYTAKLDKSEGVYTVTFTVPFSEAPSVLVTPYLPDLPNSKADLDNPPVSPTVYEITQSSFLVRFWTTTLDSGANVLLVSFTERAFSFAALEITSQKKG